MRVIGDDPSELLRRLNVNSSYYIVPKAAKEKFVTNHSGLFTRLPDLDLVDFAIVHMESKSFREIVKLMEEDKSKEEEEYTIAVLRGAFTTTIYERKEYILEKFLNHIRRNYKDSRALKAKVYYCSMIAILQSSGYGKSKLMEILGRETPTFYSSLQQGAGFPLESFFISKLIAELNRIVSAGILTPKSTSPLGCWMNNVAAAVYIYILRVLFIILKNSKNEKLTQDFKIDSEIENHEYFASIMASGTEKKEEIFKFLFNGLEDLCKSINRYQIRWRKHIEAGGNSNH